MYWKWEKWKRIFHVKLMLNIKANRTNWSAFTCSLVLNRDEVRVRWVPLMKSGSETRGLKENSPETHLIFLPDVRQVQTEQLSKTNRVWLMRPSFSYQTQDDGWAQLHALPSRGQHRTGCDVTPRLLISSGYWWVLLLQ